MDYHSQVNFNLKNNMFDRVLVLLKPNENVNWKFELDNAKIRFWA